MLKPDELDFAVFIRIAYRLAAAAGLPEGTAHADAFAANMHLTGICSGNDAGIEIGRIEEISERKQDHQHRCYGDQGLQDKGILSLFKLFGYGKLEISSIFFGPEPGMKACFMMIYLLLI